MNKVCVFGCIFLSFLGAINGEDFDKRNLSQENISQEKSEYISEKTYENLCDFVYTKDKKLNPRRVFEGSIIFVALKQINNFFVKVHPLIEHRYVLITYNLDYSSPGKQKAYLDDPKIIAWFGSQPSSKHPKFHMIPLGVMDPSVGKIQKGLDKSCEKKNLLCLNFTIGTYKSERQPLAEYFFKKPYCVKMGRKKQKDYLQDLKESKFVLSPRGFGIDCFRTWETLVMGSYPIVRTSVLDPLYKDLPVVIVESWDQINKPFLEQKYEEMSQKTYDMKILYTTYWKEYILELLRTEGIYR